MKQKPPDVMVIHDGSLPALVACLMVPDLSGVVAWVPPTGSSLRAIGADEAVQRSMASQQAELLGFHTLMDGPHLPDLPRLGRAFEQGILLLSACGAAKALGIRRVIWPIVAGDSVERLAEASERASLINRLCWLGDGDEVDPPTGDAAGPGGSRGLESARGVRLESPFVDLTPGQLRDIADDLNAPLQACWWAQEATA